MLVYSLLISPIFAVSNTETRFMRSDQANVNSLNCYKLLTSNSVNPDIIYCSKDSGSAVQIKWGFRVYKRTSAPVETQITASASDPITICTLGTATSSEAEYFCLWDCPSTALSSTDSIVFRISHKVGTASWIDGDATFQTEQLGASNLDANTWNVTVHAQYTNYGSPYGCESILWFGSSGHDSRIGSFKWTVASGTNYESVLTEIIQSKDTLSRYASFQRTNTETTTILDSLNKIGVFERTNLEILQIPNALLAFRNMETLLTEIFLSYDSVSSELGVYVSVNYPQLLVEIFLIFGLVAFAIWQATEKQ
jgi:hypothetical protein